MMDGRFTPAADQAGEGEWMISHLKKLSGFYKNPGTRISFEIACSARGIFLSMCIMIVVVPMEILWVDSLSSVAYLHFCRSSHPHV
jgi:hypothetical protein